MQHQLLLLLAVLRHLLAYSSENVILEFVNSACSTETAAVWHTGTGVPGKWHRWKNALPPILFVQQKLHFQKCENQNCENSKCKSKCQLPLLHWLFKMFVQQHTFFNQWNSQNLSPYCHTLIIYMALVNI